MVRKIALVIPEAPMPASGPFAAQRRIGNRSIRLGILNNTKANADRLLRFLVEGVQAALPLTSVVWLRKGSAGMPAPGIILDQLTAEADLVISAMAD